MLFHTWVFGFFFIITYLGYIFLRPTKYCNHWLLFVSYVFYGWWNPYYLLLILFATTLDFYIVYFMEKSEWKRRWITFSVLSNLFYLGTFKYMNFIVENTNVLLLKAGIAYSIPEPDILLPVGISFFTFQSLSYTLDFYRGHIPREKSWVRFATFVSLFPQLVAGPIIRAAALLPQLHEKRTITMRHIMDGMSLFFVGLFKKLAVANFLALYVDKIYALPVSYGSGALILATVAFGWQIYCDFSGYTDMARGIARMMGYDFMLNFNNPYLATGLGDFWNRWHISLSTWFKDYVYIPLGGNKGGTFGTYRNMTITMLVSGLWHGAAWTFIIWGALHAFGRIITRELERTAVYRNIVPKFAKQMLVFVFVTFTWIFFRAKTAQEAFLIVKRIFTTGFGDPQFPLVAVFLILTMWTYQFVFESRYRHILESATMRVAIMLFMIIFMVFYAPSGEQPFIYFQF